MYIEQVTFKRMSRELPSKNPSSNNHRKMKEFLKKAGIEYFTCHEGTSSSECEEVFIGLKKKGVWMTHVRQH
jgi:hypothetical protein